MALLLLLLLLLIGSFGVVCCCCCDLQAFGHCREHCKQILDWHGLCSDCWLFLSLLVLLSFALVFGGGVTVAIAVGCDVEYVMLLMLLAT